MGCLKTNSVGTGRKCSCPAQRFFFDTFCPPHFCQAGKRRSGRDFFFVRRLPCLSTADFTDPCKLMPSPVCLIVSSVFCLGGVRTYIVMVRNWWMSLTYICAVCVCLVRCLLTPYKQDILFAMDAVLCSSYAFVILTLALSMLGRCRCIAAEG